MSQVLRRKLRYLISNYQNILTSGNEMNLSSSNFTNSAKYLIKTKIKSIFYNLPTNKYARRVEGTMVGFMYVRTKRTQPQRG